LWLHGGYHIAVLILPRLDISFAYLPSRRFSVKKYFILDQRKKQGDCKYKPICSLYTDSSFTCTHTGGSYCGKYRKFSGKPASDTDDHLIEAQ
jgi:hypothetical protein